MDGDAIIASTTISINRKISVVYTVLQRLQSYIKSGADGIIDRDLFIDMRDTFSSEYIGASRFYNTNNIDTTMVKLMKHSLQSSYNSISLDSNSNDVTSTIESQYQSLSKAIDEAIVSANGSIMRKIIATLNNNSDQKTYVGYVRKVIKVLVILSVIDHMEGVFDSTITNENNSYNIVRDWRQPDLTILQEHIDDMNHTIDESSDTIINDDSDIDDGDGVAPDTIIDTVSDELRRIFFIIVKKLQSLVERMASLDTPYRFLPDINYIVYYTIIVAMLITNNG